MSTEGDQVNINDHGEAEFVITCKKCGSTNVEIDDSTGSSEETGMWGSIDLACRDCGCYRTVKSY